jgi:hypothetical protein
MDLSTFEVISDFDFDKKFNILIINYKDIGKYRLYILGTDFDGYIFFRKRSFFL